MQSKIYNPEKLKLNIEIEKFGIENEIRDREVTTWVLRH